MALTSAFIGTIGCAGSLLLVVLELTTETEARLAMGLLEPTIPFLNGWGRHITTKPKSGEDPTKVENSVDLE